MSRLHLEPNVLEDSTTGTAGLVAGEIAAEEELLVHPKNPDYGATSSASETPVKDYEGYALPKAQLYAVIGTLYVCAFLSAADATVVSTLLVKIASDLDSLANISWIATAYLLSSSAFQPIYGKLSDIFGRKAMLIMCSFFFTIGCFICSFKSFTALVVGRFVTGIGGSGFTVLGTVTMSDLVPLRDRGLYQGIANIFFSLGAASGGVLGGIINDTLGWQWVFILQVPIAFVVGFLLYFSLNLPAGSPGLGSPGHIKEKLRRVDFLGSALLVTSLSGILLAASLGGQKFAYGSPVFIGTLLGSLLLLGAFVYVEFNVSAESIIPVQLMANRSIVASSLTNWFYTMGMFTFIFYYPVYLSSVIGLSSTATGTRTIANFFGVSVGSVGAGMYMRKTGKYYVLLIVAGVCAIIGGSKILFIKKSSSTIEQLLLMLLPGWSYAVVLTVSLLALIAAAPVSMQAGTTSIQYTFRATGSTLGVSISSAIFQNVLSSSLLTKIPQVVDSHKEAREIIKQALKNAQYSFTAPEPVRTAVIDCYAAACRASFGYAVGTILLGVIASLLIKEHKLHTSINRD